MNNVGKEDQKTFVQMATHTLRVFQSVSVRFPSDLLSWNSIHYVPHYDKRAYLTEKQFARIIEIPSSLKRFTPFHLNTLILFQQGWGGSTIIFEMFLLIPGEFCITRKKKSRRHFCGFDYLFSF